MGVRPVASDAYWLGYGWGRLRRVCWGLPFAAFVCLRGLPVLEHQIEKHGGVNVGLVDLVARCCGAAAFSVLALYDIVVIFVCVICIVSMFCWNGGDAAVAWCHKGCGWRCCWRKRPSNERDCQGDNGGGVLRKVRTAPFRNCPMGDATEKNDAGAPCGKTKS